MDSAARFRVNSPNVVDEVFDDEVVVVNLESGRYFCLQHTAARLWTLLAAGASTEDVVTAFARQHTTPASDIAAAVGTLVTALLENQLLVADPSRTCAAPVEAVSASPGPFELPALQTFTDMQDLLLLDPIHEVDAAGWPAAKPDADPKR